MEVFWRLEGYIKIKIEKVNLNLSFGEFLIENTSEVKIFDSMELEVFYNEDPYELKGFCMLITKLKNRKLVKLRWQKNEQYNLIISSLLAQLNERKA